MYVNDVTFRRVFASMVTYGTQGQNRTSKARPCLLCDKLADPIFQVSFAAYRLKSSNLPGQKLSLGLGHLCEACLLEITRFFKKEELLRQRLAGLEHRESDF